MKKHKRSFLKTILFLFLGVKITATILYLAGSWGPANIVLPEAQAIAQEVNANTPPAQGAAPLPAPGGIAAEVQQADVKHILNSLEKKRQELKVEEDELKKEKERLEALKKEIETKIEELAQIQKKLDETLNQKAQQENQREQQRLAAIEAKYKHLVKVYTSMKPKTAAALIDKLDMKVVMSLFSRMKGEQIGQILTYVNRDRAAKISEMLAARKPSS